MSFNIWWCFKRARFWLFFKRREHALAALNEVLALDPRNHLALSTLGFLHGDTQQYAMAETFFRRALEVTPDDADTLFNLGYIVQKQDRHDDAIITFDAAINKSKTLDRAWFGKGISLAAHKRHAEAVPVFERAAKLQPMNPHALYELGLQYHKLGQPEKVAETIARLKEFDPKATQQLIAATKIESAH